GGRSLGNRWGVPGRAPDAIQDRKPSGFPAGAAEGSAARARGKPVVARPPAALAQVQAAIPLGFPALLADPILAGVRASSGRLQAALAERVGT
ncbi:MAG TPA: hypothetical protein VNL71_24790, partial [Chloroflexota bacterium]|nr:hypothetical protein [Chloroflexota bacterium]